MNKDKIPDRWKVEKLGKCVNILDTRREPINQDNRNKRTKGLDEDDLYPYYGATGQVGKIDDYLFDEEVVLLGEDGAPFKDPMKDMAYIIQGKTWVNNHAHVLKGGNNVDNKFLCYYLNSITYEDYVTGTTRLKLNQGNMKKIPIPVPSINEQKKIVSKIEALFTQLDSSEEELESSLRKLDNYRRAVLDSGFSGDLFDENKEYEEARIGDFGEIISGRHVKSDNYNREGNGMGYLTGPSDFGQLHPTVSKFTPHPNATAESGDVLITVKGSSVGKANIADNGEVCISRQLKAIRSEENSKYLFYYIKDSYQEFQELGQGTAIPGLNNKQIKDFEIPLPSIEEQDRVVEELDRRLSIVRNSKKQINRELKKVEKLRQSILNKAFKGELVPQKENGPADTESSSEKSNETKTTTQTRLN